MSISAAIENKQFAHDMAKLQIKIKICAIHATKTRNKGQDLAITQ